MSLAQVIADTGRSGRAVDPATAALIQSVCQMADNDFLKLCQDRAQFQSQTPKQKTVQQMTDSEFAVARKSRGWRNSR